jgi:MoaE-MoaD fusion protein
MRVQVLFFAVLRERVGQENQALDLPAGATVAVLLERLVANHPWLPPLLGRVQVAVNRELVKPDQPLGEGDEVALIPPVSGGSTPLRVSVGTAPLSLDDAVQVVKSPEQGAVVTFTGHVRRQGTVPDVTRLEYEAYVPMALEVLTAIADEIERETPGVRVAIHHRIGNLAVGDAAVVIATSAPHRAEAFAACRTAIERLKVRAPIWKKEVGENGAVWVGLGP